MTSQRFPLRQTHPSWSQWACLLFGARFPSLRATSSGSQGTHQLRSRPFLKLETVFSAKASFAKDLCYFEEPWLSRRDLAYSPKWQSSSSHQRKPLYLLGSHHWSLPHRAAGFARYWFLALSAIIAPLSAYMPEVCNFRKVPQRSLKLSSLLAACTLGSSEAGTACPWSFVWVSLRDLRPSQALPRTLEALSLTPPYWCRRTCKRSGSQISGANLER